MQHARAAFGLKLSGQNQLEVDARTLKKSVGQGIRISYKQHNLWFLVQKGFALIYIGIISNTSVGGQARTH
jgi:hypothetical protein